MNFKKCKKCEVVKVLDQFYKGRKMLDGHLNHCKKCVKERVIRHREINIDRIRQYDRFRGLDPKRLLKNRIYQKTPRGRERMNIAQTKWETNNEFKRKAHLAVRFAKASGKLHSQPCEVCGSQKVHAHHDDYSKVLDVRWLCSKHHAEHHKRERNLSSA